MTRTPPSSARRTAHRAKVTNDLLDPLSPDGRSKAAFLIASGFDPSRPDELISALVDHASDNPIVETWPSRYGTGYDVHGPIRSPDGRSPVVTTGWMSDGRGPARFLTLIPVRAP